jgi:CheY-like chemotaxis protein
MSSILLVDDEEFVRQFTGIILERAGFTVREACDGQEALESYRESPPDVVVTDLVMKPMGGLELIGHLRREFPDSKVVVMSAYSDAVANAVEIGGLKVLTKPFGKDQLVSAIQDLLDPGE